MKYDYVQEGMTIKEAEKYLSSKEGRKQKDYIMFGQEKYSNGETSLQYFQEYLLPVKSLMTLQQVFRIIQNILQ